MNSIPKLKGYTIKKELGHGGMASVFLAEEDKTHRPVAIKWYVPTIFGDNRGNRRFLKETKLMMALRHPGIVTVYDAGLHDEYGYLIMEYLPGNLGILIKKTGGLPPQKAVYLTIQIADALFFLHTREIVHRDIKPDNILLRTDGSPVLVDFGIAKPLDSNTKLTKTGLSVGTPLYMSPEQCQAKKVDGRSDFYSLGVLLYEMLTGSPPYTGSDSRTIMVKHIQDPPPPLPHRLRSCQPLCDALMAKKPAHRPTSMTALQRLAAAALAVEPLPATVGSRRSQTARRPPVTKRNKTVSRTRQSKSAPTTQRPRKSRSTPWIWLLLLSALALWLAHLLGIIHLPLHPIT